MWKGTAILSGNLATGTKTNGLQGAYGKVGVQPYAQE